MRSMICCLCTLAVLMQCTPRRLAGVPLDELICGLDLERNDLILELGTAVAVDNERTKEIVSRGVAAIPELRAALLNPSGKVAGFSAFCLAKLKAREARAAALAARQHWKTQRPRLTAPLPWVSSVCSSPPCKSPERNCPARISETAKRAPHGRE